MARIYTCDACGKKSSERMLCWTSYSKGIVEDFDFCRDDAETLDQLVRKLVKNTEPFNPEEESNVTP